MLFLSFKFRFMWSKTTEYAIRSLIQVDISNAAGYPAKILQSLVKAGMLSSVRGRGGGFFFDPKKPELKLAEVIRVLEGEKYFTGCVVGLPQCNKDYPCPMHSEFSRIRADLVALADQETIQSLARRTIGGETTLKRTVKS